LKTYGSIKSRTALMALLTCALPVLHAADDQGDSLFPDRVIARGEGFTVQKSDLDDAFITLKANLAARGQSIPSGQRKETEARLLDRLIVTEILTQRSTSEEQTRAREMADNYFAAAGERAGSPEELSQQLASLGMSPDKLKSRIYEQALSELVIDRDLKSQVNVTDDAIKQFYEQNPAQFERPPRVRASHVLISIKDPDDPNPNPADRKNLPQSQIRARERLMEDILQRARDGEDFAELAREYSEDPGSKDTGGEYTFAKGEMVAEFEAAAFSLKPGQISDIVNTMFGFHIIKLHEKMPAETIPLESATDDIREFLARRKVEQQLPGYFQRLKTEANTEILEEELKNALQEAEPAGDLLPQP
jgi:peptidyl-prolyl cis-trans isomerase C